MFVRVNLLGDRRTGIEGIGGRFRSAPSMAMGRSAGVAATVGCIVVAGFLGARALHLHTRYLSLAGAIETAVADSISLTRELEDFRSLVASQERVAARTRIGRELDGRRYVWPHLLDQLSVALPSRAWLVEVTSVPPRDSLVSVEFSVQVMATSASAITEYIRELERSPFIEGVSFVHAVQGSMNDRTVHRFGLEARYEIPDSAAIRVVPFPGEAR